MTDMIAKGRSLKGVRNPATVLTEKQVIKVRQWKPGSGITLKHLAEEFGVATVTLEKVRQYKTWRHV